MKIFRTLEEFDKNDKKPVLTIGNFDGMHLGHQAVLKKVASTAQKIRQESCVITFENHPIEVLFPGKVQKRICTLDHKIKLIEEAGIDHLILLTFTEEFSKQTAQAFLEKLYAQTRFSKLVLGHDATIGKEKHGSRKLIEEIARISPFDVEYLSPLSIKNTIVSSSKVRALIDQARFEDAAELLGRPYSIYAEFKENQAQNVQSLCLPPDGEYDCQVIKNRHPTPCKVSIRSQPIQVLLDLEPSIFGFYEIIFQRS